MTDRQSAASPPDGVDGRDRPDAKTRESTADPDERSDSQAVYDRIATHFAQTREYVWPEVESFVDNEVDRRGELGRGLDLGCGNGRHTELLADRGAPVVGLDVSRRLLTEATHRAADRAFDAAFVHGDAARLPFDDSTFSHVVYTATIHHLRPRATRLASLAEIGRILTSDGRALVSAWSTVHDRFDAEEGFDTTVDWTLPDGECVGRFYHIYDPDEFRRDLADAAAIRCLEYQISSGNCYAVIASVEP